jgi:hypothetical protein
VEAMSKKRLLLASLSIIAILTLTLGLSYAWFTGSSEPDAVSSAMATVDVSVPEEAVVTENEAAFTIANNSNIGTYLRIGWTPIYQVRDENNNWVDTARDTSHITVSFAGLEPDISGASLSPEPITSSNGYSKNMLTMADTNNNYFVLPGGMSVSGKINLTGVSVSEDGNERLVIVFIPEALQATKKAVESASAYGWDAGKVLSQDGSIAGGGN